MIAVLVYVILPIKSTAAWCPLTETLSHWEQHAMHPSFTSYLYPRNCTLTLLYAYQWHPFSFSYWEPLCASKRMPSISLTLIVWGKFIKRTFSACYQGNNCRYNWFSIKHRFYSLQFIIQKISFPLSLTSLVDCW